MDNHVIFTNPLTVFDDLMEEALSMQREILSSPGFVRVVSAPNKLEKCICDGDFPPSNIYEKNGDFHIDFACAGYTEDDIQINYEDNYLYFKFTAPKQDDMEGVIPLKRGIRLRDLDAVRVFIDIRRYDVSKIDVTLNNGILSVCVKPNKDFVKEFSIGINGNPPKKLSLENAEDATTVEPEKKGKGKK